MTKEEMLLVLLSLSQEQLQTIKDMVAQLNAHSPQWQEPVCHNIKDKAS